MEWRASSCATPPAARPKRILPFFVAASLLAPGVFDYSLEAGLPRLSFGTSADSYVVKPVASASLRYGVFDWLTVAGHAEGGAGLMNGSVGLVARTGSFGVASFAVAASRYGADTGFQTYLSYETTDPGLQYQRELAADVRPL